MKITKTLMLVSLLFGSVSIANAASTHFSVDSASADSTQLDVIFSWDGNAPTGLERVFTSSNWTLDAKTNPGTSSDPEGIFVLPKHESDGAGRTHYFADFSKTPYTPLSWEYAHGTSTDYFTLEYLSVVGNSSYTGAELRLTATHVAPVPIPAALWLFGSGLLAFAGFGKLRRKEISVAA